MVRTGEESGLLPVNLLHTAKLCEEEFDRRVNFLARIFEPTVIVIVGACVFLLYMALLHGMWAAIGDITRMARFRPA